MHRYLQMYRRPDVSNMGNVLMRDQKITTVILNQKNVIGTSSLMGRDSKYVWPLVTSAQARPLISEQRSRRPKRHRQAVIIGDLTVIDSLSIAITPIDFAPAVTFTQPEYFLSHFHVRRRLNHLERLGVAHQLGNSRPSSWSLSQRHALRSL